MSNADKLHLGNSKNVLSICALAELANVLHSHTYSVSGVSPGERLVMIRTRKLARTIIQNTMDVDEGGNHGKGLLRAHVLYLASMIVDSLDHGITSGIKSSVSPEAIKSQINGCLGTGWEKCIVSDAHPFIRQFQLKDGIARMSTTPRK